MEEEYDEFVADEEQAVEEAPAAPENMDKPEFVANRNKVLGIRTGSAFVVSRGAQVAYVNWVLGVEGDEFTEETEKEVRSLQERRKVTPTGKVSHALYAKL